MKILETQRLVLQPLTVDDVDNLLGIFSDSEAMRYYPATKNRQETEAWIQWNLDSYSQQGYGLWAAIFKDSGQFVGQCGLVLQRNVEGQDEVEIGYSFLRKYWNRGFATEAASASRDYGFEQFGLKRIVSLIHPQNRASRRVAEKVGMSYEKEIDRWNKRICVYAIERLSH